jgi:hypothetical protein
MLQSYEDSNKAKKNLCLDLKLEDPKNIFGKEANIWKLIHMGLPPSKKIYVLK